MVNILDQKIIKQFEFKSDPIYSTNLIRSYKFSTRIVVLVSYISEQRLKRVEIYTYLRF